MCGSEKIKGRGLCEKHYRRFLAKMESFAAPEDSELFEAKCIEHGWITERSKGGRPKERDPFDEIADLIVEGRRQAAEAKERYETTNPPKTAKKTKGRKKSG